MAWEQFQKQRVFWQEIDHIDEWMKGNMYRRSLPSRPEKARVSIV